MVEITFFVPAEKPEAGVPSELRELIQPLTQLFGGFTCGKAQYGEWKDPSLPDDADPIVDESWPVSVAVPESRVVELLGWICTLGSKLHQKTMYVTRRDAEIITCENSDDPGPGGEDTPA